jgi:hypothetical protein
MKRSLVLLALLLGCLLVDFLTAAANPHLRAQEPKNPPTFAKEKLDLAEKLIREVFQEEFTHAQADTAVKAELARTLLAQAKEIQEEANVRFVALSQAPPSTNWPVIIQWTISP